MPSEEGQPQQFRMVRNINWPGNGNLSKYPLMELCERIDQSRRGALDSSNMGADLVSTSDLLC